MNALDDAAHRTDLIIRLKDGPGAVERVFRLVAAAGRATGESTVPDPDAALAAVERFGQGIFFPEPGPPKLCTQQYGGPQVAVVTGTFHARQVNATFQRTDGCEISRWNALAALLGGTAPESGRI